MSATNTELIKANAEVSAMNVELMMQRLDLMDLIKEGINVKPSDLSDWKRSSRRMLRKLERRIADVGLR